MIKQIITFFWNNECLFLLECITYFTWIGFIFMKSCFQTFISRIHYKKIKNEVSSHDFVCLRWRSTFYGKTDCCMNRYNENVYTVTVTLLFKLAEDEFLMNTCKRSAIRIKCRTAMSSTCTSTHSAYSKR